MASSTPHRDAACNPRHHYGAYGRGSPNLNRRKRARGRKLRMNHDQSFDYNIEDIKSNNQRVIQQSLSKCVFGFAARRLVHAIIALRRMFPWAKILCGKIDYKSAFCRLHLPGQAALQSTLSTKGLSNDPVALVSLRVTFGGRPSPSLFSEVSKFITDLANALARCES